MTAVKSLRVGITGGIGAGKSTVAKVFATLKIPLYDADTRAKWLMNHQPELKEKITAAFGAQAYRDGQLDRTYLAEIAFKNPEKLNLLNQLVHPAVGIDFEDWAERQTAPYVLKEAALLFESGSYQTLNAIITVTAPEEVRIARVIKRDSHRSREDVANIIARQWPEERKMALSNFLIKNDETELVIPQVLGIHKTLLDKVSR